jgi:phospholipid transport system substrate-binding protein
MKKIFKIALIVGSVLFIGLNLTFAENSPKMQVQLTIDKLTKVVTDNDGAAKKTVRRQEMRKVIDERFDFEEMAKRSLGIYWSKATPEEQKEYVVSFSELLMQTYMERLEGVKPGMVNIKEEKIKDNKSLIKTSVKIDNDVFPIDYKLIYEAGSWQVYDVIIENIGLVANYRLEFAGIIRKEKMAGLLVKLKEKVAKL